MNSTSDKPNQSPGGSGLVIVRRPQPDGRFAFLLLSQTTIHSPTPGLVQWSPPVGQWRSDESVVTGLTRSLVDSIGLSDLDLCPIDLSLERVTFVADVPAKFEPWLTFDGCSRYRWTTFGPESRPQGGVADPAALAAATVIPPVTFSFRPLTEHDLSNVVRWRAAEHVSPWISELPDVESVWRKYRQWMNGENPDRIFVILANGVACGFCLHYRVRDHAAYREAINEPEAVGIDVVIGDPGLVGRRLGAAVYWRFVRDVIVPSYPEVPRVVSVPLAHNSRAIRALAKAGFVPQRNIRVTKSAPLATLCTFEPRRWFSVDIRYR